MSVSENHGVYASGGDTPQWIKMFEVGGKHIQLVYDRSTPPMLTPDQARYLASKLYRMARRLDLKKEK
jgi:hypothetical protein